MTRVRPPAAGILALALLAGACSTEITVGPSATRATPGPASPEVVSPAPTGRGSAAAALERLCRRPAPEPGSDVPAEGPTPPAVEAVQDAVEELRGLEFTERVAVEAVTRRELVEGLSESFDAVFPDELFERRSLAWQTIGVVPEGTDIRRELEEFASGQVIGYYDTLTGELVFIGTEDPSPLERVTLAHELTHAIDDQNFGLERIDRFAAECRDDTLDAALGVVEGSATFFMTRYVYGYLTLEEQIELGIEAGTGGGSTAGVPEFLLRTQEWPYVEGLAFVQALHSRGGVESIDRALRELPVSTEQVIHPERYPNDVPQPVDVPDLAPELGRGWEDLDVQHVGEAWLAIMLGLRLDRPTADDAAAGWDGGIYRAWSDGEEVAVVLATVWDTPEDAAAFAGAMAAWIAAGGRPATALPADGNHATVLFASDADVLSALSAAR